MPYKNFAVITLIFFLSIGCKSHIKKIENTIRKFQSHPITIHTTDYIVFCSDSTYNVQDIDEATLKYICYVDSTECSPCVLKKAFKWNDYICKFRKHNKKITFTYIISSKNSDDIITQARESGFCQTVFIDTSGVFSKQNPHIPKESMYHIFLLDENNRIILVGNPLTNKGIEKAFFKIAKIKLSSP